MSEKPIAEMTDRQVQELMVMVLKELLALLERISVSSDGRVQVDIDRY